MDKEQRFEFVVVKLPYGLGFLATLGEYDEGAPVAQGNTAANAIIDWLQMHGETLDG